MLLFSFAQALRDGVYGGVPVLFVPGNSGSHKQVRSMASVALRKALDDDHSGRFHFDYFSVDFNEEFSALYGGTLEDQVKIGNLECIKLFRLLKCVSCLFQ